MINTLSEDLSPSRTANGCRDLDKSLFSGIAWTGSVKSISQAIAWASTLVVARLLTPADFGLVSMASVYLGMIAIFSEFGIGTAVVSLRELSGEQLAQLNTIAVLLGIAGLVVSMFAAIPLGWFFAAPQLPPVVAVMAAAFVITSFQVIPSSLLQRELRFKLLSVIDGVRGVVLAAATLAMALVGFGYWTLVLGALLSATVGTALTLSARRYRFQLPRLESLRSAIRFSSHILVSRLSWYAYSNADFVVAGRMLGQASLGVYTIAWTFANLPLEKLSSLTSGVTPAFFSAVQTEKATLRHYFLNLTEGMALITFPLTIGLALVANDFVILTLGYKWQAIVPPLQLLALYASVRSITPLLPHILNVTGETRFGLWLSLATVISFPTAFYIGSRWGTVGIAAAWMVVHPVLILPAFGRVFQKLALPTGEYLRALRPALDGSLLMAVALLILKQSLVATWPLAVRLTLQLFCGAAIYITAVMTLHRKRVRAIYERIQLARAAAV